MNVPKTSIKFYRTAALDGGVPCEPIRLVQYDKTMPVAAIALTENGVKYTPPAGALLKVRMKKADGKGVYNDALGLSESGEVLFLFTQQMTAAFGQGFLNVEVTLPDSGAVKCSDAIPVFIAENAVQEGQIESADEFLTLVEILEQCKKLAAAAQESAEDAQDSAEDAALSMQNAANSAAAAAKSAAEALSSKNAAAVSASQAADSAQGIQEAKDDAAQSAASAEESAIRAENAARESLGFRTFNGSVRPDENGDLDPSRPMFAGTGENVTVKSTGDRINNVIVHGFTEQAGSGDPSPDNVREISVAGIRMQKKVITGLEVGWRETGTGTHKYYACALFDDLAGAQINTVKLCSSYLKPELSSSLEAGKPGIFAFNNTVFLKSDGVSTLDEQLEVLKNTNLTVWYVNNSKTGDIYIPIETQGAEYRCACVKINDFLCEGDTVDTNGTERHLKGFVLLTGNENFQPNNQQFWPEGYAQFYAFSVCAAGITDKDSGKCSHAKYAALASDRIPSVTVDNSGGVYIKLPISVCGNTSETIEQYLISQAQNGTPVEIEYTLKTPSEYTNPPTELTAVPSDDGTFTVSADAEPDVYLKPLTDASTINGKKPSCVAISGSYEDLEDKPTAADIGALGKAEKAESAKVADNASGSNFYMGALNLKAGVEAQSTGVRLSWGKEYSYKLFFGQDPTYGDALCLHASSNGTYALGNSTARWASIYSTNGTIQTSDATRKEQITALGEKQLAFFEKLRPVSYKLKSGFDDAENHDRLHYGFIAQEVEQAMGECGITAMEFGGLCKDKEIVLAKTLNEDGTESLASKETGADIYSLRYQEFIALNTAAIQALKREVTALKAELNTMKKGDAET